MKKLYLFTTLSLLVFGANAQKMGDFTSVTPNTMGQQNVNTQLTIPSSHTFQIIIKRGDLMTDLNPFPDNVDFTGYVPVAGSSRAGYVNVNSELTPGGVSTLKVNFNETTKLWNLENSFKVDFTTVQNTANNCSGGITPWGTTLTGEETTNTTDVNLDGYHDIGWLVEVNPVTHSVVGNKKLWKLGKFAHENAAPSKDSITVYEGCDNGTNGFVYKFVSSTKGNYDNGDLYVLKLNGTLTAATGGTWVKLDNSTPAMCNTVESQASTAGATNFNGVEDVEIGPDGFIYFAAKGTDRVYRFKNASLTTLTNYEIFIDKINYTLDNGQVRLFQDCDNLAFDADTNLWILEDGANNYIWMAQRGHTAANPKMKIFGNTPGGSEATGITFTPDFRYMFISMQHPNPTNIPQSDASGNMVAFNEDATLVIARNEHLGIRVLPVNLRGFNIKLTDDNEVLLAWQTAQELNNAGFEIQKADDKGTFKTIGLINGKGSNSEYTFIDVNPVTGTNYYRLKQIDIDGKSENSEIKSIDFFGKKSVSNLKIWPNPLKGNTLNVNYKSKSNTSATISIKDALGKEVMSQNAKLSAGDNNLTINTSEITEGQYTIELNDGAKSEILRFLK